MLDSLKLNAGNTGPQGFLMFENPDSDTNGKFVDGFRLGALLRDASVPVLILNACQSAAAEARSTPETETLAGTREEVEAYGSLAQAVMDAGAAGVVAMRYSVYVVTATQFVAELYGALARGRRLGEAVTWARRICTISPTAKSPTSHARCRTGRYQWCGSVRRCGYGRKSLTRPQSKYLLILLTHRIRTRSIGYFRSGRMLVFTVAMKRCMRSTELSITTASCCCTPMLAAARPRRQRSSRAGMN